MTRSRRPRPSAPQDGFTLVEILVAAALTLIVLIAASDLIANTMARSAKIQQQEQARMVAYQVSERARAFGCGLIYGSEPDFVDRGTECQQGLAIGTVPGCSAPSTPVFGDVSFCWADGTRQYDVEIKTGWDYSAAQDVSVPAVENNPDTFVRRVTVTARGGPGATATAETREPAPADRVMSNAARLTVNPICFTPPGTSSRVTIRHTIESRDGRAIVHPKPPTGASSSCS